MVGLLPQTRVGKYVAASVALAGGAVSHAWWARGQFYPAVVLLATSRVHAALIGNLGLCGAALALLAAKALLAGRLSIAESERLEERIKDAAMELCLALTIFRADFTVFFAAALLALLALKSAHWLFTDRVTRLPAMRAAALTPTPFIFHARLVCLSAVLFMVDTWVLKNVITSLLKSGPSANLLFWFELLLLSTGLLSSLLKYAMFAFDAIIGHSWENKGLVVFYLELATDLLHLALYVVFFAIIMMFYGIPLHLIKDLYWTFRSLRTRIQDFIRFRRATANLSTRFPDATAEAIEQDNVCIICREDMVALSNGGARPKCLRCGHIFHMSCLRTWLERQQTCPTCRDQIEPRENASQPANAAPNQRQRGNEGEREPQQQGSASAQPSGTPAQSSENNGAAGIAQEPLDTERDDDLNDEFEEEMFGFQPVGITPTQMASQPPFAAQSPEANFQPYWSTPMMGFYHPWDMQAQYPELGEQGDRPLPRDQGEGVSQAGVEYTGDRQARAASQGSPLQMPFLFSPTIGAESNFGEASANEIAANLLRIHVESLKQYTRAMESQLANLESQPSQWNETNDANHNNGSPMQADATSLESTDHEGSILEGGNENGARHFRATAEEGDGTEEAESMDDMERLRQKRMQRFQE